MSATHCPLCLAPDVRDLAMVDSQRYYACQTCSARFLDPAQHPSREVEKQEYDLHRNDPDDPGYRQFLSALFKPMMDRLPPASAGLDYGCGPGPALAAMFREAGHGMALFDPIYRPDRSVLERDYDFVTCTEVAEHFHRPHAEFNRIDSLLRSGGYLGLMTRFQTDDDRFAHWHYRRDPTHVIFYREDTIAWIADRWGWSLKLLTPGAAILRKNTKNTR